MGTKITIRPFTQTDGYLIARWVTEMEYFRFFRNNAMIPSVEECCNYPAWSQNLVMMVEKDERTVGMVNAYQVNYRNRIAHAGCLIDKSAQGDGTGHNAMTEWITYLFNRFGFRKIIVEHVDEYLTPGYLESGFTPAGRRKAHCDIFGELVDEIELECFREDWKPVIREQQEGELAVVNGRR